MYVCVCSCIHTCEVRGNLWKSLNSPHVGSGDELRFSDLGASIFICWYITLLCFIIRFWKINDRWWHLREVRSVLTLSTETSMKCFLKTLLFRFYRNFFVKWTWERVKENSDWSVFEKAISILFFHALVAFLAPKSSFILFHMDCLDLSFKSSLLICKTILFCLLKNATSFK